MCSVIVVDNWNSLSAHSIDSGTINTFKMHVLSELKTAAVKFFIVIVGIIWRKPDASHVHERLLELVSSVNFSSQVEKLEGVRNVNSLSFNF